MPRVGGGKLLPQLSFGFILRDAIAGAIASIVLIANIVSFGALMFPGEMSAGAPVAIWSMLIGSSIAGLWIALRTSLPPITTGIDSPTGAVLVLVSANASAAFLAAGIPLATTVQSILLLFTLASVFTGTVLCLLGSLRLGSSFRFVPYFVVAGFLAATGLFLLAGAVRMTTGWIPGKPLVDLSAASALPMWIAVAIFACLLLLRHLVEAASAIPLALVALTLLLSLALNIAGLTDPVHGWYFPSLHRLSVWWPWSSLDSPHLRWDLLMPLVPEWLAIAAVALISLVTKVSSLEVARHTHADLDREFRIHGIGTLAAAPVGGMLASLQTGTSRLLEQTGGATRFSGAIAAVLLGAVGISGFDLQAFVPIPVIAGLVIHLAYGFLTEAFWKPIQQRAWRDFYAAIAIMIVCALYGYLMGVLAGIIGACLLFALSYARIGTIRRRTDRARYTGNVDRPVHEMDFLRGNGAAIRLYWLSGYIFFGSSESVFETIKDDVESSDAIGFIVLDFSNVTGADTSAIVSLTKLRNFCDQNEVTIAYSALARANADILHKAGFYGGKSRHRAFADAHEALGWCEEQLLAQAPASDPTLDAFEGWLQRQLGGEASAASLLTFFQRRELPASTVLYRSGDVSDTVDLVASGSLSVDVLGSNEATVRRRRIATHTVLGEMGFFRRMPRSATVSTEQPTVLFTLTRARWETMLAERPDIANVLYLFILGVLADRIEFSNREIAALSG